MTAQPLGSGQVAVKLTAVTGEFYAATAGAVGAVSFL
jgi:hypothetical protein